MQDQIKRIEEQIETACLKCGRPRTEVKLVAVSKTKPLASVQTAYDLGLRVFGESRAQEFRDKVNSLPDDIEWHFIGHLQKNKIKYIARKVNLVHSVDSIDLAKALSEYALKNDIHIPVLMEVNMARELSKYGVAPEAAVDSYLEMCSIPGLNPKGFMTIGPNVQDENQVRAAFSALRDLQASLKPHCQPEQVAELSMGMTQDFGWAIEEGSTIVRVGTAIFGSREVM